MHELEHRKLLVLQRSSAAARSPPALAGDHQGHSRPQRHRLGTESNRRFCPNGNGHRESGCVVAARIVETPAYWRGIYAGAPASAGCDTNLGQGVKISAPLYVAGNLCMTGTVGGVRLQYAYVKVLGWASAAQQLQDRSAAEQCPHFDGSDPRRLLEQQQPIRRWSPGCTINQPGGDIWDDDPTSAHASPVPTPDPLPTVDWAAARALQENTTPVPTCTNGRSLSEATFVLNPNASYSCTSGVGSITYTYVSAGPSTLQLAAPSISPATSASRPADRSSTRASAASSLPDRSSGANNAVSVREGPERYL